MKRVRNYGKTWTFRPERLLRPTHPDEISEAVKSGQNVRVMGARHSWSEGIVTEDTLLTLDAMQRIVTVDREEMEVTVEAGIRLKNLIAGLEKQGLALANMGSIAEQSLAGATCTGTHGTGIEYRCLVDQCVRIALIDGRGEKREIGRDHPDFDAVAVGLGGFGIVYEMTMKVVPSFQMLAVTEAMPFDQLLEELDDLVRAHDHFKVWWFVPNKDVIIFRQDHTNAPRNDSRFKRWFKDEFLAVLIYRPILALQKVWRDGLVVWTNRVLGGSFAKRFERICRSYHAFLTPSPPVHRETEWAFDYADARALLAEYRELMLTSDYTFNFVQELRVTKADTFWASPSYGRDSIWLSMYNIDRDERYMDQRKRFERFAWRHGGRPHWGKEAEFDRDYLCAQYEKLEEYGQLMREYDPEGKFANEWLRGIFPR